MSLFLCILLAMPVNDSVPSSVKNLSAVTVTAQKPLIVRKIDRTIFNVDNIGGDALDAIKKAPGVQVSNNQFSIAGKSTVSVMLNGRLVQLSGDELTAYLRSIPSANISRIEVITTPPARYDAAGNSGIINIITKKSTANGLNGNITATEQVNTIAYNLFNGAFNYRKDRLNIFGNASTAKASYRNTQRYNAPYPDQQMEQQSNQLYKYPYGRYQAGIDYNITPNTVLGVLYTYGVSTPYMDEKVDARLINNNHQVDSIISTQAYNHEHGRRHVGNINYEWRIDTTGKKLNIDLDYFTRLGTKIRDFTTIHIPGAFRSINHTSGQQQIDISTARMEMEWPAAFANYSFGGKLSMIKNTSDNTFQELSGRIFLPDEHKSNEFDYTENTQALYASAGKKIKHWEMQLGMRAEYTQTKSISQTLSQTNINKYFKLYPTLYLQYAPDDNHVLNINYSKRVERPDFWSLNPFRSYKTTDSYEEGNPFLQPSFSNNLELVYTLHTSYTFSLYSNRTKDLATTVSLLDTATKSLSFTMGNVGQLSKYGFTSSATFHPFPWWENMMQVYVFYTDFSSHYYNTDLSYKKATCYINAGNNVYFDKNKTFSAELNAWYQTAQIEDFELLSSRLNVAAGVKKLLLNKTLTLALAANDIFRTEKVRRRNQYNGAYTNNYYDQRYVSFSVSYKFGNRGIKARRFRKSGIDEDRRAQ